jgi:predicted RNA binding protein YcfA (HicA-like mRNA interferase family)
VCINTSVDSRTVIAKIEAAGWREVRQKGSHKQFKHPTLPGLVTVPHPKRDLPIGTLRSIERVSGVVLS